MFIGPFIGSFFGFLLSVTMIHSSDADPTDPGLYFFTLFVTLIFGAFGAFVEYLITNDEDETESEEKSTKPTVIIHCKNSEGITVETNGDVNVTFKTTDKE